MVLSHVRPVPKIRRLPELQQILGSLRADPALPAGGSLALFGELDLELGLGFISWMEVMAYAGMQAITNIYGGRPFSSIMYTPVLGVRVAWGSF